MWMLWYLMSLLRLPPSTTSPTTSPSAGEAAVPPVPPLRTANVAVDATGTAWISHPSGLMPMAMEPLGGTNPGTTPPLNPRVGTLWWDAGVNELKAWNGTAWIASAGGGSGGIGEPTIAGSFLRTNTGTWVAGLPLAGGTLTANATISMSRTGTGGPSIMIDNTASNETGLFVQTATATGDGIVVTANGSGAAISIGGFGSGARFTAMDAAMTGTMFSLNADGTTMIQSLLINTQPVTFGPADSGGTGFRQLVVPN